MDWQGLNDLLHEAKWHIAGVCGAVIASFFHRDELESKRDFILFFVAGWACAYFLTGFVSQRFGIDTEDMGAVGFLLGAFGGSLISAVIKGIRSADLWGLVKQRLGGGN